MHHIVMYGLMASPPTKAHQEILFQLAAIQDNTVFCVPSADGVPVGNKLASATANHRLNMLKLAVEDHPGIFISDIEIALNQLIGLPSYTVNTLIVLKEGLNGLLNRTPLENYLLTSEERKGSRYEREFLIQKRREIIQEYLKDPTHEFLTANGSNISVTLAIGEDSYNTLSTWDNAWDLVSLLEGIIVFQRGNIDVKIIKNPSAFYDKLKQKNFQYLAIQEKFLHYSSTQYRHSQSQKYVDIVPVLVHEYAQKQGLYSAPLVLNVGTVSLALKGQDWSRNLKLIYEAIDRAYENGDHILCFGELTLTSASCADNFQYSDNTIIRELLQYIADYASPKNMIVSMGHPWYFADKTIQSSDKIIHRQNTARFNRLDLPFVAQSILYQGKIVAMTAKTVLEKDEFQSRHFQEWHPEEGENGVIHITLPEMTSIPEEKIPFGMPIVEMDFDGKTVTLSQIIGNQAIKKTLQEPTHIVLNPHAGAPISLEKQLEEDWNKQFAMRNVPLFVSVNNTGNAGGEQANFGNMSIYSYGYAKIKTLLSGFDEVNYNSSAVKFYAVKNAVPTHQRMIYDMHRERNQHEDKTQSLKLSANVSLEEAQFELTMYNDAQWLFDYLRHTGFNRLVMTFSGDVNSVYNAIKVRTMVELIVNNLGIQKFAQSMGYFQEEADAIKAIMKKILVCVTFSEDLKNQHFIEEILGASFCCYHIEHLVVKYALLCGLSYANEKDRKTIAKIKDRTQAVFALQLANLEGGIGIAHTNLDNLCENDFVFGGNLQAGQLGLSAHKWRETQIQDMKRINGGNNGLGISIDCGDFIPTEEIVATQRRYIFQRMLKDKPVETERKNNPREVFEQCYQTPVFSGESIQQVYEKIKHCYQNWAKAQIGIHAKPLSQNFDHDAVNHEELRTPNIHGYHRQELAQLTLYCLFKEEKITESFFRELLDRVLIDAALCRKLLDADWNILMSEAYLRELKQHETPLWKEIVAFSPLLKNTNHQQSVKQDNIQLKLSVASCNQTAQDWAWNFANICKAIDVAIVDGADLLLLQELVLSGYDCEDTFEYTDNALIHRLLNMVARYAASKNSNLIVSIGHPWKLAEKENPCHDGYHDSTKPFNVQTILSGGEIVSMSAKKFLYNYARGYESRHFCEWRDELANQYDGTIYIQLPSLNYVNNDMDIHVESKIIPFGSPITEARQDNKRIRIFHSICEESWIAHENAENFEQDNPLAIRNKQQSVTCALNPNASPPSAGKHWVSQHLAKEGSKHCQVFMHANFLGTESLSMVGFGTGLIAQNAEIISESPMLSTKSVVYSSQVVSVRSEEELTRDNQPHAIIHHVFSDNHTPGINNQSSFWCYDDNGQERPKEEILFEMEIRNEILWLFDYMRKNGVRGFTQALSGGADSAYNAAKLRLMPQVVIQEQGIDAFLNALHYSQEEQTEIKQYWPEEYSTDEPCWDMSDSRVQNVVDKIMEDMLTCAYLKTRNNSPQTQEAARMLVKGDETHHQGIGGKYWEYDIQPLIDEALWSFANIKGNVTFDQKNQILMLLQQFFRLNPTSIEKIYNEHCGENSKLKKTKENHMIAQLTQYFYQEVSKILGSDAQLTGKILSPINPRHGLALENLQARTREIIILLITDHEGKSGLSNPNLNESIRSYTTWLGDLLSGHLCPNAHKHKFLQLEVMRFLCDQGLKGIPPVVGFGKILNNKPSAELQSLADNGEQLQNDEVAMRCSYRQNWVLAQEMFGQRSVEHPERKKNPIEVFDACRENMEFKEVSVAQLYDMILVSYKAWISAQHKLRATPPSMTYGDGHYADPKKSMKTPCVNAYHATELGQLMLYCLNKIAEEQGTSFEQITGYPLKAAMQRILVDHRLTSELENLMWKDTDLNQLGSPKIRKIENLYNKMLENDDVKNKISTLFSEENRVEKSLMLC